MCTIASIDHEELITFFALWFLSSVFFGSFVILMSLWIYNLFYKIFTPKVYKLPTNYFDEIEMLDTSNAYDYVNSFERELFND